MSPKSTEDVAAKLYRGVNGNAISLTERKNSTNNSDIQFTLGNQQLPKAQLNLLLFCSTLYIGHATNSITLITLSIVALVFHFRSIATSVDFDTLLVVESVGIQITSKKIFTGFNSSLFLPWTTVEDVFINEVITGQKVLYYLTFVVKEFINGEEVLRLVPLFQELKPAQECLEYMYTQLARLIKPGQKNISNFQYEGELMKVMKHIVKCQPAQTQRFKTTHLLITFSILLKPQPQPGVVTYPQAFTLSVMFSDASKTHDSKLEDCRAEVPSNCAMQVSNSRRNNNVDVDSQDTISTVNKNCPATMETNANWHVSLEIANNPLSGIKITDVQDPRNDEVTISSQIDNLQNNSPPAKQETEIVLTESIHSKPNDMDKSSTEIQCNGKTQGKKNLQSLRSSPIDVTNDNPKRIFDDSSSGSWHIRTRQSIPKTNTPSIDNTESVCGKINCSHTMDESDSSSQMKKVESTKKAQVRQKEKSRLTSLSKKIEKTERRKSMPSNIGTEITETKRLTRYSQNRSKILEIKSGLYEEYEKASLSRAKATESSSGKADSASVLSQRERNLRNAVSSFQLKYQANKCMESENREESGSVDLISTAKLGDLSAGDKCSSGNRMSDSISRNESTDIVDRTSYAAYSDKSGGKNHRRSDAKKRFVGEKVLPARADLSPKKRRIFSTGIESEPVTHLENTDTSSVVSTISVNDESGGSNKSATRNEETKIDCFVDGKLGSGNAVCDSGSNEGTNSSNDAPMVTAPDTSDVRQSGTGNADMSRVKPFTTHAHSNLYDTGHELNDAKDANQYDVKRESKGHGTARFSNITDLVMKGLMFTIKQDDENVKVVEQKTEMELDEVLENSEKVETKEGEKGLVNSSLLRLENLVTKIEANNDRLTNLNRICSNTNSKPLSSDYSNSNILSSSGWFQETNDVTPMLTNGTNFCVNSLIPVSTSLKLDKHDFSPGQTGDLGLTSSALTPSRRSSPQMYLKKLQADNTTKYSRSTRILSESFHSTNDTNFVDEEMTDGSALSHPGSQVDDFTKQTRTVTKGSNTPRVISDAVITSEQMSPVLRQVMNRNLHRTNIMDINDNDFSTSEDSMAQFDDDLGDISPCESMESLRLDESDEESEDDVRESPEKIPTRPDETGKSLPNGNLVPICESKSKTRLSPRTSKSRFSARISDNESSDQLKSMEELDIKVLPDEVLEKLFPATQGLIPIDLADVRLMNDERDVTKEFHQDLIREKKQKFLIKRRNLRARKTNLDTQVKNDNGDLQVDMWKLMQDITRGVRVIVERVSDAEIRNATRISDLPSTTTPTHRLTRRVK